MKYWIFIFLITVLAGCKLFRDGEVDESGSDPLLERYEWRVDHLERHLPGVLADRDLTLRFDTINHTITADGGCNLLSGKYSIGINRKLDFRALSSTKLSCPQIQLEQLFYNALQSTDRYEVDQQTLLLYQGNRRLVELRHRSE
jgi:heat shock protein HslJ